MDDIRNRDETCLHDPLEHLLDRCAASLDRHELIAEVDRLKALNFAHNDEEHDCGTNSERARILAGMEGLKYEYRGRTGKVKMWVEAAAVIAIVKGEKP
jgi:hypothetical protein